MAEKNEKKEELRVIRVRMTREQYEALAGEDQRAMFDLIEILEAFKEDGTPAKKKNKSSKKGG